MYDAARSAIEIEARLKRAPLALLDQDLSPHREVPLFSTTTLVFLLWVGLRHEDRKLAENTVVDWVSEVYQQGGGFKLCYAVRDAIFLSGVCGFSMDQEAKDDDEAEEENGDGDEGKASVRPPDNP